tara:strand:+ start:7026 stop:9854 length:2829 start_codon:yes stop_codon:yes gene_type:complete
MTAQSRDSIDNIWGDRTPYVGKWPDRPDYQLADEPERWVQSACVLCSNGCGLDIGVKEGKIVGVRGRTDDRVNRGRLGPKGLHGWIANHSDNRLTQPLIRRDSGQLEPASWDEAMELIVRRSKEIYEQYTANAIGFYTSGQLFLEEYYTLAVIGKAGLGTPHMDGNTRLCTATAAAALKESFGSDGQPGSYTDLDMTEGILHVGHNISNTQTVLWMRILDRLSGPNPPKLVVIDPRRTATAAKADVHLAPRVGTNVPLLNGLLHLIIEAGHIDQDFIDNHTMDFDKLRQTVAKYSPERVEELTDVPVADLRAAATILGEVKSLVSTVLQGVYQSNQATAAAVQVNNINLIRGLIGKPGSGVLQMNGQPTAQNTRECGADGDLPAFRNWENPDHVQQLADLWNIEKEQLPAWKPPTHALEIFRYAEKGTLKMLWISATNPAVSLPDLHRVRAMLARKDLFVVAQDGFHTETTLLADVVLPAAIWGEKTGCFTNVDRTVHISHKAIEPPGEARADLDIWLDYARRMDFRDKDGEPLIKWNTPEEAFDAWRECTRGQLCDYTGMSYEKLSGGSGIQWPCNEQYPHGREHLYSDYVFRTFYDTAENFGHDLDTGAAVTPKTFKALNPAGRALLKGADYVVPHEIVDEDYPLHLTTGRVVFQFHTRTKTAHSRELNEAAPDAFIQLNGEDAERLGIEERDMLQIESRRGWAYAPARIGDIEPGHVFMPFHYGYWDNDERPRAVNEMTLYEWDPVSKQPYFKYAAVRLRKMQPGEPFEMDDPMRDEHLKEASENPRAHVADYLGLLDDSSRATAQALFAVAEKHKAEPDIGAICKMLARFSQEHSEDLQLCIQRYGETQEKEADKLLEVLQPSHHKGPLSLLRDLHDCWLLAQESHISIVVLKQATQALRDDEMMELLQRMSEHNSRQLAWLKTRIKQTAPQSLIVPS